MGLKSAARRIWRGGVPIVAVITRGPVLEALSKDSGAVGFPVLIKASAGGGAKACESSRRE